MQPLEKSGAPSQTFCWCEPSWTGFRLALCRFIFYDLLTDAFVASSVLIYSDMNVFRWVYV